MPVLNGHIDLVRMLMFHCGRTNSVLWNNETTLHLSAECGYVNIVKELIVHGADWHRRNVTTALQLAEKQGQLAVFDLFAAYEQYDRSGETDSDSSHTSNFQRDGCATGRSCDRTVVR